MLGQPPLGARLGGDVDQLERPGGQAVTELGSRHGRTLAPSDTGRELAKSRSGRTAQSRYAPEPSEGRAKQRAFLIAAAPERPTSRS